MDNFSGQISCHTIAYMTYPKCQKCKTFGKFRWNRWIIALVSKFINIFIMSGQLSCFQISKNDLCSFLEILKLIHVSKTAQCNCKGQMWSVIEVSLGASSSFYWIQTFIFERFTWNQIVIVIQFNLFHLHPNFNVPGSKWASQQEMWLLCKGNTTS